MWRPLVPLSSLTKRYSWLLAPGLFACPTRHFYKNTQNPSPTPTIRGPQTSSLSSPQEKAVHNFIDLCSAHKISRVYIGQDGQAIAMKTLDHRAASASDIMSVTKAVTGMVIGVLMAREHVSPSISLKEFSSVFPPPSEVVTIWDILHHTTALRLETQNEVGEVYRANDIVNLARTAEVRGNVGRSVRYSNLAVNLLNPAVKNLSGLTLRDFAQKFFFSPLDIPEVLWEGDRAGNQYCMAGLHLRIEDLIKIGSLIFSGGRYDARQVLPESWVRAFWKPTNVTHQDAIGGRVSWANLWAQTYTVPPELHPSGEPKAPPDCLSASGFGGQFIVALRRSRLLIVTQRDMELDDSRPHLGGNEFSDGLDDLDDAFAEEGRWLDP